MRILKSNVLLRIVNSYVVDSPQPANLSYLWNFGSLLAVCLGIQILTGCFLAMHYIPNVDLAFNSVEHIMRDVENGYVLRYTHANVASFFFIFVYAPIKNFIFKNFNLINKIITCTIPYGRTIVISILNCNIINFITNILLTFILNYNSYAIRNAFFNIFKDINIFKLKILNDNNKGNPKHDFESNELITQESFIQWFVGFTDAEGSFIIQIRNNREVHFRFRITLHVEDSVVLFLIKDKLGIGVIKISGNTCTFTIDSFQLILDILLPIFDKYSLITHKQLDYRDWRTAILIKKNSTSLTLQSKFKGRVNYYISPEDLKKIEAIKNGINSNRINFEGYNISYLMISKFWLLGFVEGDGSFYITNNRVSFTITQKDKQVLEAISIFFKFLKRGDIKHYYDNPTSQIPTLNLITDQPLEDNTSSSSNYTSITNQVKNISLNLNNIYEAPQPNCTISSKNKDTAYQLTITDMDVLFQYIFPFFNDLTFLSRKGVDFKIWGISLFLIIHGYSQLPEGRALLIKLSNNMNNKRYFSNILEIIDKEELFTLFKLNPPFNINSNKSHFILAKEYSLSKGSLNFKKNHNKLKNKNYITAQQRLLKNSISFYSTVPVQTLNKNYNNIKLNPWFITGLTDGDGSFLFTIIKSSKNIWRVQIYYHIVAGVNPANLKMLEAINSYFNNIGVIRLKKDTVYGLTIVGIKNCLIVKNHFDKYPLLSYKLVYYNLWSQVLEILLNKQHLNLEGLNKIIALKAHCKTGLSDLLLNSFPNYVTISCPTYSPDLKNINMDWICGFINADGYFLLINKKGTNKLGESFRAEIKITQNDKSLLLLKEIILYLGFGNIYSEKSKECSNIKIANLPAINSFILKANFCTFLGAKALDYSNFCKGINLINNKAHLTIEGINELKKLKSSMNNKRTDFNI
jgi:hypothetical protein